MEGRGGWWMSGGKGWMVDEWREGMDGGRGGGKGWMVDEWREGMDGG